MSIYSYICKDCGGEFDILVGVSSEKEEYRCKAKSTAAKYRKNYRFFQFS